MINKKKIIVGITGASGSIYADFLIKELAQLSHQIETCGIVISETAIKVWDYELQEKTYENTPYKLYHSNDLFAPFASGSAGYDVMIICPCSMGTLGKISSGIADNLITRTADVMLKERKKLICVIREAPLSLIHINNMKSITESGGIIFPASPSFYQKPSNLEVLIKQTVERILDLAGLTTEIKRWGTY